MGLSPGATNIPYTAYIEINIVTVLISNSPSLRQGSDAATTDKKHTKTQGIEINKCIKKVYNLNMLKVLSAWVLWIHLDCLWNSSCLWFVFLLFQDRTLCKLHLKLPSCDDTLTTLLTLYQHYLCTDYVCFTSRGHKSPTDTVLFQNEGDAAITIFSVLNHESVFLSLFPILHNV